MQKLITVLLFFLSISISFAQSDKKKDKGFDLPNGFRGGYQSSDLRNDNANSDSKLNGGYFGYSRTIKLIPFLHLETGMEYMVAGASQTKNTELQLHYLVLPIQGVLKLGPFVGMAGINGNFRLAEKYTVDGVKVNRKGSDRSAPFDVATDVGLGFNILFLRLEARYYWGLIDVEDGWRNRYLQLGLAAHF